MKHTKLLALLLAGVLAASLTACGSTGGSSSSVPESSAPESSAPESSAPSPAASTPDEQEPEGEIIVFAAASMTETLNEIKTIYEDAHPGVTITYNFDSSGTLKTQIEEGADCDLFISAGQTQMNQLDIEADPSVNTDGLDFVDNATRLNLLENKVTLCVPDDNPKGIESFDDLAEAFQAGDLLFCMGNSDVPVGQYTQKILAYYGLDETALANEGLITYGSNVKEVTTQVKEGSVDCGVIYCTDAFSAELKVVDSATEEMCGQVIYPAAVLKNAPNHDAAQAFLDYLTTDEAMAVFETVGFSPVA